MEKGDMVTHRIDGYLDTFQGDMYLECQLITKRLDCVTQQVTMIHADRN